mmetsp:Transcript_15558/g.25472  ORF Transcript_15558/g.25472 Transcript_15558/m.25472 type:complete len:586 (+) Transcript_15558:286-2043(+)
MLLSEAMQAVHHDRALRVLLQVVEDRFKNRIPLVLGLLLVRLSGYSEKVWRGLVSKMKRSFELQFDCSARRGRDCITREFPAEMVESLVGCKRKRKVIGVDNHPWLEKKGLSGRMRRRKRGQFAETNAFFADSILWKSSTEFYEKVGIGAWSSNDVPFGISSSVFVAQRYAQLCQEFSSSFTSDVKTYILDLGAGHGVFAYRLALCFKELGCNVCVVMTDFHTGALHGHFDNDRVRQLAQEGWLDLARVDLSCPDTKIDMVWAKRTLNLAENPIVLVANYVLDSLPPDIYRRVDGDFQRATVTCWPRKSNNGLFKVVNHSTVEVDFKSCESTINVNFDKAVLYPTTGIRALNTLVGASSYPRLIVVGDKMSDTREDEMWWATGVPGIDRHGDGGCVSCSVDPYVLEEALDNVTGSWHAERPDQSFGVSAFLVGSIPQSERLGASFRRCISGGFSISDFDRLRGWLESDKATRKQLLSRLVIDDLESLIAVVACDFEFFNMIKWDLNPSIYPRDRLCKLSLACFETCLPLGGEQFLLSRLEMGRWLYVIGSFRESLAILEHDTKGWTNRKIDKLVSKNLAKLECSG